jgi:hypothetical protein
MRLMRSNLNLCWRSSFRSLRTANHFDVPSSTGMARGRTKRSNIRKLERSEELLKINLIEQNRNKREPSFARFILSSPQTIVFEKGLFPMVPHTTQRTNCNQHHLMIHTRVISTSPQCAPEYLYIHWQFNHQPSNGSEKYLASNSG